MASAVVQQKQTNTWAIFPNPSSEDIFIDNSFYGNLGLGFSVLINDNLGKKVFEQSNVLVKNQSIPIHYLQKGVYILSVFDSNNALVQPAVCKTLKTTKISGITYNNQASNKQKRPFRTDIR